jgi:hypothetical protein
MTSSVSFCRLSASQLYDRLASEVYAMPKALPWSCLLWRYEWLIKIVLGTMQ